MDKLNNKWVPYILGAVLACMAYAYVHHLLWSLPQYIHGVTVQ